MCSHGKGLKYNVQDCHWEKKLDHNFIMRGTICVSWQIITIETSVCIPPFYDSKASWKTCYRVKSTNMCPFCLTSHTTRKNTEQVGGATWNELGFIRQIKQQTNTAGGVGEPPAMTQTQFITLWEGPSAGLHTVAHTKQVFHKFLLIELIKEKWQLPPLCCLQEEQRIRFSMDFIVF